jgi:hypothetical protein
LGPSIHFPPKEQKQNGTHSMEPKNSGELFEENETGQKQQAELSWLDAKRPLICMQALMGKGGMETKASMPS